MAASNLLFSGFYIHSHVTESVASGKCAVDHIWHCAVFPIKLLRLLHLARVNLFYGTARKHPGTTRKEWHISGWWWWTPDGDVSYGENGCGIQVLYVVVVFPVLLWRFSFLVMSVPLAWSWFKFHLDQGASWIPLFCPPFALGSSLLGHFRIFSFTSAVAYQTNPTAALLSSNTYNTKLLESSGTFCWVFFVFCYHFRLEGCRRSTITATLHQPTLSTTECPDRMFSSIKDTWKPTESLQKAPERLSLFSFTETQSLASEHATVAGKKRLL